MVRGTLAAIGAATALLAFAACTSASPGVTVTPAPSPTALPTSTAAPQPATSTLPVGTPTAAPVSDTESVIQYVTAYAYLDRGDFDEAERYFNTVVELEPEFARAWDGRGQARLFKGELEDALLDFDRAISLKPNLAQAYAHRAFARVSTGDDAGAERDANKALTINEDIVDAHIVLGKLLAESGRTDEALERFDRAVALSPLEGTVYWWRGQFYRDFVEDYDRALADFNRSIGLSPAQATIYIDRAMLLIYMGSSADLIKKDLEEAISLAEEPRLPLILDRAHQLLNLVTEAEATGAQIVIPR